MKAHKICYCEENHEEHLCELKKQGQTKEILHLVDHISSDPTVSCLLCGALAKSEDYVCTPVELDD
jgi:hypothetical protein